MCSDPIPSIRLDIRPMNTPSLPPQAITDLETILKAGTVAFGPAGFAGTIPEATEAYWRLLKASYGGAVFRLCAEASSPAARLYGLMGLYQVDHPAYVEIASRYRDDTSGITYLRGCMGLTYPLNTLLTQIESGYQEESIFAEPMFPTDS